jgi:hypothetical protein
MMDISMSVTRTLAKEAVFDALKLGDAKDR